MEKIEKSVAIEFVNELKSCFPQFFEDGKLNINELKALLEGELIEREDERFFFTWAGKSKIFKLLQNPAYYTLNPIKEKSINFDTTENIIIEGENLDVLKLMLKSYHNKIKMIYIDPPYNTGKDYIYKDNFKKPIVDYLQHTLQKNEAGDDLTSNSDKNGRYHSDWLNFIYPRLYMARNLLSEDGVIFVSIDDNEIHHLRLIMDDIFGEENFVSNIIWQKKFSPQNDATYFSNMHDYILCYAKIKKDKKDSKVGWERNLLPRKANNKNYKNLDNDERGDWTSGDLTAEGPTENCIYPIISYTGKEWWPPKGKRWVFNKENYERLLVENRIWFGIDGNSFPRLKRFLSEVQNGYVPNTIWFYDEVGHTQEAKQETNKLFGQAIFEYPKPVRLIKHLLKIGSDKNSIVLDFFAGSGTTGQAVLELNKEDDSDRKFILININEPVKNEEIAKEYPYVSSIMIERLKRVSQRLVSEQENSLIDNIKQDFGFKVFKLSSSNFNLCDEFNKIKENGEISELKKEYFDWLGLWLDNPLTQNYKEIEVVYEIFIKNGFGFNSIVKEIKIANVSFYYVKDEFSNNELYICLSKDGNGSEIVSHILNNKYYKDKVFIFIDGLLNDNECVSLKDYVCLKGI